MPAFCGRRDRACGACRRRPPPLDALFFAHDYRPPFDAVVHGLKYRGLHYLARPLANELFDLFAEQLAAYDLVVPIPLHRWRRIRRGFNQAQALAEPLAKQLGKPWRSLLVHRRGRPQSALDHSERAANARRLLRLGSGTKLDGEHVLLVDDVTTTGATLHTAARLLAKAGADSVGAAVVARTPSPGAT